MRTVASYEGTVFFFFQAEDGIRDLVRSRGLGDVYKRQLQDHRPRAFVLITVITLSGLMEGVALICLVPILNLSLIHI